MQFKPKNLIKKDLNVHVAKVCGLKENQSSKLVNSFFKILSDMLSQEDRVKLSGFGTFKVKFKSQRIGRNPKNLKLALIPARNVVSFKISKILQKMINHKLENTVAIKRHN